MLAADGSDDCRAAFDYLAAAIYDKKDTVMLYHCQEPPVPPSLPVGVGGNQDYEAAVRKITEKSLELEQVGTVAPAFARIFSLAFSGHDG